MTATNNSQAAAGPASAAYRNMTDKLGHLGLNTAVPEGVRALAQKAVRHRPVRPMTALRMLSMHP